MNKYTQAEAKKIVHQMLLTAVKMKSNLSETMGDLAEEWSKTPDETGLKILKDLNPLLFNDGDDQLNLIVALQRYDEAVELTPEDFYNALYLANREIVMTIGYPMLWRGEDLPDANLHHIIGDWRVEDESE